MGRQVTRRGHGRHGSPMHRPLHGENHRPLAQKKLPRSPRTANVETLAMSVAHFAALATGARRRRGGDSRRAKWRSFAPGGGKGRGCRNVSVRGPHFGGQLLERALTGKRKHCSLDSYYLCFILFFVFLKEWAPNSLSVLGDRVIC